MKEKKQLRQLSDEELAKVHGGGVINDYCEKYDEKGYCVIEYDSPVSPVLPGKGPTAF